MKESTIIGQTLCLVKNRNMTPKPLLTVIGIWQPVGRFLPSQLSGDGLPWRVSWKGKR